MPLILGTNSIKDTGYEVANSCRFNDDSDDHLDRTPSSSGNRRTWTWSCWFKRASFTSNSRVFVAHSDNSNRVEIGIHNETVNCFRVELLSSSSNSELQTNAVFRDPSAWFHAVVAVDTTQGTDSNRVKLYINGTQVTSFQTESYPTQNTEYVINHTVEHNIGKSINFSRPYDGYMCEVVLIDGTQLDASSFGEFDDSGIWKPIDVSGLTFGTNGFYLDFENSGSLGADVSGNGNNFTVNNLTSVDQSTDTCTNNFATLNPLYTNDGAITYSEGNLKAVAGSGSSSWTTRYAFSNIGVSAGRWYMEAKCVDSGGSNQFYFGVGKDINSWSFNSSLGYEDTGQGWGYYASSGNIINNGSDLSTSGASYTDGDIISMELDLEDNTLDFYKNGVKQGSQVTSLPAGTYHFVINGYAAIDGEFNFGSPNFSISSGNSDGNGYGNFEYSVPSGHYALNTKNLAEYG